MYVSQPVPPSKTTAAEIRTTRFCENFCHPVVSSGREKSFGRVLRRVGYGVRVGVDIYIIIP
jgi:hypothetical protein